MNSIESAYRSIYENKQEEQIISEEYIETLNIEKELDSIEKKWKAWKKGPETSREDIGPAKKEVIRYLETYLK